VLVGDVCPTGEKKCRLERVPNGARRCQARPILGTHPCGRVDRRCAERRERVVRPDWDGKRKINERR
jgi:hypothetical protein